MNNIKEVTEVIREQSSGIFDNTVIQSGESKSYISLEVWKLIKEISDTIKLSDGLPKALRGNPATIVTVLLTGKEMGMTPMRAIKGLYPVNGIINIYGAETVRRLREHGYRIEYIEEDEKHCKAKVYKTVYDYRKEGKRNHEIEDVMNSYTEDFKFEDAVSSGWTGMYYDPVTKSWIGDIKPGWTKGINRKLKMRYGVLSLIIKTYIPEVLGSATDIQEIAEDYKLNNIDEEKEVKRATFEDRSQSLKNFINKKNEVKLPLDKNTVIENAKTENNGEINLIDKNKKEK